jgi:DNA-binding beta-propeller fold protein YncE
VKLPEDQEVGMVSWIAREPKTGVTWLIQRGDKADPVLAIDADGKVLHSFGRGLFKIPHAIRLDAEGNVWTVDAGSSRVIKFSPEGRKILQIDVGGERDGCKDFCGATDVTFAPAGEIFVSDGYANARIVEYTREGRKVREWGSRGTGRVSSTCRMQS